jgi:DNA repair protein RadD
MKLRDRVQAEIVQAIRSEIRLHNKALVQACTGLGKSYIARKIMNAMSSRGVSCIFIAPDVSIIRDQVADYTSHYGECSVYSGTIKKEDMKRITFATRDSVNEWDINKFEFCIVDESQSYSDEFFKLLTCKVIGLSATPWKEDTGYIYGADKFFNKPCFTYTPLQGIKNGLICDYKIDGESLINANVNDLESYTTTHEITLDQYSDFSKRISEHNKSKIVILCCNIEHAEIVHNVLIDNNEQSLLIHSKVKKSGELLEQYKNTDIKYLVSVSMISQGFDCCPVDCVIYLRPIASIRMMLQSSGRGLRLFKNKEYCLMLDYADVFSNCGEPKNPNMAKIELASMPLERDTRVFINEFIESKKDATITEIYEKLSSYSINKNKNKKVALLNIQPIMDKNGKRCFKCLCTENVMIWINSRYNAKEYYHLKKITDLSYHAALGINFTVTKKDKFYKLVTLHI